MPAPNICLNIWLCGWVADQRRNMAEERERRGAWTALLKSLFAAFCVTFSYSLTLCLASVISLFNTRRYKTMEQNYREQSYVPIHQSCPSCATLPFLCPLLHFHAADWLSVPADVQLDARGWEGGEREEKDRGNETCVFSLMADFPAPLQRLSVSLAAKRQPSWLIKMFLRTCRHRGNPWMVTAWQGCGSTYQ